jgi:predicted GNAT family acetyltransferase
MMSIEKIVDMIEEEFAKGRIKQVASRELIRTLESKGIESDVVDDAIDEAERRKIIAHGGGFYNWIDPSLREAEKAKTQRYFEILAEVFRKGEVKFLPREDLKSALRKRGLDEEAILRAIVEAERDYVLDFYSDNFGPNNNLVPGCSWIPPEEREKEAEAKKADREFSKKWHEKKVMQDDY